MTPQQDELIVERNRFASEMHDAAAEMRCRAKQLRTEADCLDRAAERLTAKLIDAGVISA